MMKEATYLLLRMNSDIYEENFEQGQGKHTGCGLPLTPIAKKFETKEAMLKWVLDHYGYKNFEETVEPGIMEGSKLVADHSNEQNGGWFEPTDNERELWKDGKMKMYTEEVTLVYHKCETKIDEYERNKWTFYFTDHIEMNGKGITRAVVDGEEMDVNPAVEHLLNDLSEDIPDYHNEDYEMSIYFGNATAFTYDIMPDYNADTTPDELVEKIQEWLNKNTEIKKEEPGSPSELDERFKP